MPKLKKPPKNAYFFFITAMKDQREREGFHIGGFQNASMEFGPQWSRMTKEEKAPYEQMAKKAKEEEKYNVNNKYTVTGETYAQVHQKVMEQKSVQEEMEEFIRRLTSGPEAGDRMYIFMKSVYSVEEIIDRNSRQYWPIELSLAAFSLKGGLKAIYTTLVNTVTTPTGYASAAKENSEETLLPMPGDKLFPESARDYLAIMKNINGFANHYLKDGYDVRGHRHVFFALDSEREPIISCLQWMVNKLSGRARDKYQYFVDNLKVYRLSKLILCMAEEANRINRSYENYLVNFKLDTAAEAVILKGNYDYREEIACGYHQLEMANMKMHNCAQSIVMRRVFMLFEEFVPAFKFQWIDRHRIDKLGKSSRGPVIKKKREETVDESKITIEEPSWMKPDVSSIDPASDTETSSFCSITEVSNRNSVKRKADIDEDIELSLDNDLHATKRSNFVASNPACNKTDEAVADKYTVTKSPTMDWNESPSSNSSAPAPPPSDDFNPWSRKSSAPSASFTDSDFPSLGGASGGRGHSSRPPLQANRAGRGRGASSGNFADDVNDDDDPFPALGGSTTGGGAGRGRGRGRYWD